MNTDYSFGLEEMAATVQKVNGDAGQIDSLLEKINGIVTSLESVWTGTDAQTYVTKINEYRPSIVKLKETYVDAMDVLQKTKNLQAEEASARAAKAQSMEVK